LAPKENSGASRLAERKEKERVRPIRGSRINDIPFMGGEKRGNPRQGGKEERHIGKGTSEENSKKPIKIKERPGRKNKSEKRGSPSYSKKFSIKKD